MVDIQLIIAIIIIVQNKETERERLKRHDRERLTGIWRRFITCS
jgi:hypothetical protein